MSTFRENTESVTEAANDKLMHLMHKVGASGQEIGKQAQHLSHRVGEGVEHGLHAAQENIHVVVIKADKGLKTELGSLVADVGMGLGVQLAANKFTDLGQQDVGWKKTLTDASLVLAGAIGARAARMGVSKLKNAMEGHEQQIEQQPTVT